MSARTGGGEGRPGHQAGSRLSATLPLKEKGGFVQVKDKAEAGHARLLGHARTPDAPCRFKDG